MIEKKRIYYFRTYRHLKRGTVKNVIYLLLLLLPSLFIYFMGLHPFTGFMAETGVKLLDEVFPGMAINIATIEYPVFGAVDYIIMPTVLPDFSFCVGNMAVILFIVLALAFASRNNHKHPVSIYLTIILVSHLVSCVYFTFAATHFPYKMKDFSELYISQQISIWLIFIILSLCVTGFVGNKGYLYKCLTYFAIMAYSLLFGAVRYFLFLFILEKFSMLYMTVMFFVCGPMFDFMYLVCIYSFFINKMTKYYGVGKGREDWQWS